MIMSAVALLHAVAAPTETDVRAALDGNLCRCGSHQRVIRAVLRAAAAGGPGD
jgi:nicotinate dehydrogenase subunit A